MKNKLFKLIPNAVRPFYGRKTPIGENRDSYYFCYGLSSVRQVINYQWMVTNYYTYNPFGELIATENPFMFMGQFYDAEIAEDYLLARRC